MSLLIEQAIKETVNPLVQSTNGWYSTCCAVCGDHTEKGLRAGFKFEDSNVVYKCWNCGFTCVHDESAKYMTTKSRKLFTAFNIDETFLKKYEFGMMSNFSSTKVTEKIKYERANEPISLDLKDFMVKFEDVPDTLPIKIIATAFLEDRKVNPNLYGFYIASGKIKSKKDLPWKNRLIIPIYKGEKIVYYQGVALLPSQMKKKYLNASAVRDNILYNYATINKNSDLPIYVLEGFFDAYLIDGVCIFGRQMSKQQIEILDKSPRTKVIVPDRFGDGADLANQALDLGWSISTPDIGECKDVNDSIIKYGKMYTLKQIRDNIKSGFDARTSIGFYCN